MLNDTEWRLWSNRSIADHCGVSEYLVRSQRDALRDAARAARKAAAEARRRDKERQKESTESCDKNAGTASEFPTGNGLLLGSSAPSVQEEEVPLTETLEKWRLEAVYRAAAAVVDRADDTCSGLDVCAGAVHAWFAQRGPFGRGVGGASAARKTKT
jgi:hypothetical protein